MTEEETKRIIRRSYDEVNGKFLEVAIEALQEKLSRDEFIDPLIMGLAVGRLVKLCWAGYVLSN